MKGRVVAIGASFSGIEALCRLLGGLPAGFPAPILVTQHIAPDSPDVLPRILGKAGALPATHACTGDAIEPGRIYVAPPDRHVLVERGRLKLSHGPRENFTRPAVDPMFRSAALAYGPRLVGVVLTGHLDDGTAGLLAVKDQGGTTVVQDPEEATAQSMPRSALRHVAVDHCLRVADIATLLVRLAADDPDPAPSAAASLRLLEIENRIAAGIFGVDDWRTIEAMSVPSGLNCPDCRSALYEMRDARVLRFRCRSGHGCSARSLLSAQAGARETMLSALFGTVTEEATLTRRLLGAGEYLEDAPFAAVLRGRLGHLGRGAAQVAEWLRETSGLIEPDPPGVDAGAERHASCVTSTVSPCPDA